MAAKPLDQIVQEHLGALQFALCQAQAENEALKARLAELEPKPATSPQE